MIVSASAEICTLEEEMKRILVVLLVILSSVLTGCLQPASAAGPEETGLLFYGELFFIPSSELTVFGQETVRIAGSLGWKIEKAPEFYGGALLTPDEVFYDFLVRPSMARQDLWLLQVSRGKNTSSIPAFWLCRAWLSIEADYQDVVSACGLNPPGIDSEGRPVLEWGIEYSIAVNRWPLSGWQYDLLAEHGLRQQP